MRDLLARRRATRTLFASIALALAVASCGDTTTTETGAAAEEGAMADGSMEDMDEGHDHHDLIEVPEGMAVPEVAITTEADSTTGLNLFVDLKNFTVAPEHASTEPVDGEGHLHLYIDGERVLRFYNRALQITGLDPGEHEISVEVSANDHSAYAVDDVPIRAVAAVQVEETEHSHMTHDPVEVDAASAPEIALTVIDDPKSGWNLQVDLVDFAITPENVGGDHVDGEGHLHLYVDGERITRLYGTWWHLAELTEGSHEITVELSGNAHAVYAIDGEPIVATATIDVSADQASDGAEAAMDQDDMDNDMDGEDMEGMEADLVIEATVAGETVETADDRVDIELGSVVKIRVDADSTDQVHLHGYDRLTDVAPGAPAELMFTADVAGVFEVELENTNLLLFEIAVS